MIDSVTVQVDDGPTVDATLKNLPDPQSTLVSFTAPVQVAGAEGVHTITAVATNDAGISRSVSVTVFLGPSFQIDAPAIRLEIALPSAFSIDPADATGHSAWSGRAAAPKALLSFQRMGA